MGLAWLRVLILPWVLLLRLAGALLPCDSYSQLLQVNYFLACKVAVAVLGLPNDGYLAQALSFCKHSRR